MSNSVTKKAIQARKWRSKARDKCQLNNIIASYVEHKYITIYKECYDIYLAVKDKYPDIGPKCNLAKTPMFRRLIQYSDSSDDDDEKSKRSITRSMTKSKQKVGETDEAAFPASPATSSETTTPASPATSSETTTPASPATSSETTMPASPATSSETAAPASPAASSETITPVSPATSSETTTPPSPATSSESTASASPIQPQLIPVQHLHVGYNGLGEIVDQLTDEGEYVNIDNINNDVFMNIFNELEQDDDLQMLLNNVEVQHLEEPIDMDEGIELGILGEDDDFNDLYDF